MKKVALFMVLILCCSWQFVLAQKTITGTVTDAKDGLTLPGVSIVVKGTTTGTLTDISGNFTIKASADQVLLFTFIGYKAQEIAVGNQTTLKISLVQAAEQLDEVVVIGYGTTKKKDLTGAIATVNTKQMNLGGTVTNAAQALQGKTAGVVVTQSSRAPGQSATVRIRGLNSISSSNEPLYVVDGFPSTSGSDINPNDIESMQILKDASATAIYGARGANGVILITTKRGKQGDSHISFTGTTTMQTVQNPFNMLNGKDYMTLANDLYREIDGQQDQQYGVYSQTQLQSTVNTDWIAETTRTGKIQDYNMQFQGGNDKTRMLGSVGYFNQDGVLKNTSYTRISARVNVDQKINDYVKAGVTMYGQRANSNFQQYTGSIVPSNVLLGILNYDPTVPPYNEDGTFGRPPGGKGDNPLANLVSRTNDQVSDKYNGNIYLEVEPIKGLTARFNGGAEMRNSFTGTYLPKSTYQGGIDNGVASTSDGKSTRSLFDAVVTYSKVLQEVHSFSIMGGLSYEKTVGQSNSIGVKGFSTDAYLYNNIGAAATLTTRSSAKSESMLRSYFGRLNYSYNDKYLATFTLRSDASSRFGADNQVGLFPSGSLAWRMDQEDFIKNLNVFSNLKFRISYGVTGNDQVGNYASLALVSATHLTFDGSTNTGGTHLNQGTPENPLLKWESTTQYNTGFDMGFFNSRLLATLDLYYKKTSDLLLSKSLPMYSGFISGISNVGDMENKGFEVELTSRNFIQAFKWDTKFSYSMNKNKIVSIPDGKDIYLGTGKPMGNVSEESFAVIREGESLGSLFGYEYLGVFQTGETYAPQPNAKPGDPKFADLSGPEGVPDGKITSADRVIIGHAYPKAVLGLTNTFSYKNFDLTNFWYAALGQDLLNMNRMNLEWNRTEEALNRWTTSNTNTDIPRNGFYYSKYGGYTNSHFIEKASFLRMKTLTLGYTLPTKSKYMQSLRVYFMAENLIVITNYSGWDPEVDTKAYESGGVNLTANAGAGLDFNSYPSMKSFTFGLNLNF
jgi:TonB-dependent starch-binding outer membrane protein SusC